MIPCEVVVCAGPGDGARAVAGVPVVLRALLVAQRLGIRRAVVVGAAVPVDPRLRIPVAAAAALAPAGDPAPRLVVGPGTVFDRHAVDALAAAGRDGAPVEAARGGAWLRLAPGPRMAEPARRRITLDRGTLAPATVAPDELTAVLLRGLENPRDGYLDHLLHRRLSRPTTRVLLRASLGPNAVTVLGILAGVLGGVLLGIPGVGSVVAAVACLVASGVLDCSDGEIARIRFRESRLGHVLDVTGDTLVHGVVLFGIARRMSAAGAVPAATTLAALGLGVLGAFAAITWAEATEGRRLRVPGWENRLIGTVLSPLTTRDWHVFPLLFAAVGRLEWLVPAAAVGAHVFWAVTVGVLARVLRRARLAPAAT